MTPCGACLCLRTKGGTDAQGEGAARTIDSLLGHVKVAGDHTHRNVLVVGWDGRPIFGEQCQKVIMEHYVIPATNTNYTRMCWFMSAFKNSVFCCAGGLSRSATSTSRH